MSTQNVGKTERMASVVGGGALVLTGVRTGSIGGLILTALGGACVLRGVTGHCQIYEALGINSNKDGDGVQQGIKVEKTILVRRPRHELFQFWKRLENLPMIMPHLTSVERVGPRRSRWTAEGFGGKKLSWEAEIINEKENELLAWQSIEGSDISNAGSVRFTDASDGQTQVSVNLQYLPPAGKLGAAFARILGENPAETVMHDLMEFRSAMESPKAIPAGI